MQRLSARALVPIRIEDVLFGFILLGERKERDVYPPALMDVLLVLGNQSALAVDNLKSLEEMKKIQGKLFHAEKLAYVGQLASSVVHEVRNPLTAIKTFVSYLPEKFRRQDLEFLERFEAVIPHEVDRI